MPRAPSPQSVVRTITQHYLESREFNGPPLRSCKASIRDFLTAHVLEGVVWHHPDGRMAKIKRRDFGLRWPEKK